MLYNKSAVILPGLSISKDYYCYPTFFLVGLLSKGWILWVSSITD